MDEIDTNDGSWQDWPQCPACEQRRQAVCPVCKMADDDIPLAEFIAPTAPQHSLPVELSETLSAADLEEGSVEDDEGPILLMCPHCDEAFPPRFYRHCARCGHDFGFGITVEAPPQKPRNTRVATVMTGLLLLAAGFFFYFWWLLRR